MAEQNSTSASRRGVLKQLAAGAGFCAAALVAGCGRRRASVPSAGRRGRLRAAFSSAGLQGSWNRRGKEAAELWGRLLDVDVVWFDGEFNGKTQRDKIQSIVEEDWDFCSFQAHQTDILEEPVARLKKRGIPVISMDTLIVERRRLRDVGVWLYIASDHVGMAEKSTRYMIDRIGGEGKVIHIGGQSGHSGAQDRAAGFNDVLAEHPQVEVLGGGVQWCDWDRGKARETFRALLAESEEPIAGAFFHNDDMALACVPELTGTRHENMIVTAVDGQEEGLQGVRDGRLAATAVNPTCLVHGWSLIIGQFIVRNKEPIEDVPLEIICPSPMVALETGNLDAMSYLSDPQHSLL